MSNKVIIEITEKGWTKKVIINDNEFTEDWKLTYFGAENKGQDLEQIDEIPDELYNALSSNDVYECALALKEAQP